MSFEQIDIGGGYKKIGYTYWISGIYKIVCYKPGQYNAYYIKDNQQTWGSYTEEPPMQANGRRYLKTRNQAKAAINRHKKHYTPSLATRRRAKQILDGYREKYYD